MPCRPSGMAAAGLPGVLVAAEVATASDAASRRLTYVVIGLVVLAAVIAVATVLYWRATRPTSQADPAAMRWVSEDPTSASAGATHRTVERPARSERPGPDGRGAEREPTEREPAEREPAEREPAATAQRRAAIAAVAQRADESAGGPRPVGVAGGAQHGAR